MNTKKLLSTLLVSLGAFTLVLTSCGKKNPTPEPTAEPTVEPTVQPTLEPTVEPTTEPTVEPTVVPSEPEPTVVPSEPEPTVEPTDPTVEPTDPTVEPTEPTVDPTPEPTDPTVEPTDPTVDPTPGPTDPTVDPTPDPEPPLPEETVYDVTFNYDEALDNLTVWTDYAIDGTIAPEVANISENSDVEGRHTAPLATGGLDCGIYFFAVDADGYIIYASYGLGVGYGSPSDGYYHNQEAKDVFDAPYWSLHEKFVPWGPSVGQIEHNGQMVNPWTLYDFVIPEGGFVVRGHADEANMKDFWKVLTGQFTCPKQTNITLEGSTNPGDLNNFYVSINEDHQLTIRERTEAETRVDGVQEEDTPSMRFEPTADDEPAEYLPIAEVNALADDTVVEGVRGVITQINGTNIIIEDEAGNAILIYEKTLFTEEYKVGDTVVLSGTKVTYQGYPELKSLTSLEKIEKYGSLKPAQALEATAENVGELWVADNMYKMFNLVKAEVISINAGASSVVKLGETEITLFKAHFPETVAVGDFVDVKCSLQVYSGNLQGRTADVADMSRYYNVTVDVDGVDGVDPVVSAHASGQSVTMTASHADANYTFSHWEKLVGEAWEEVSTEVSYTITVGEVDEQYRAVFNYAAWTLLPSNMGMSLLETPDKVNGDAGGDAFAVLTEGVLHADGAWTGGAFNSSWRTIIAVDAEGKVAYAVSNPANGYGGPSGTGYYAHPDYSEDYTLNPAFNILEGYGPWTQEDGTASTKFEIVVPEGGFIMTAHGTDAELLWTKLGAAAEAGDAGHNNRDSLDAEARVFYDEANNQVRIYVPSLLEENWGVTLNKNGYGTEYHVGVFVDDESNPHTTSAEGRYSWDQANGWRYAIAVNAEGRIVYASYGLGAGYGSPADDFYHDGSMTKATSANKGTAMGEVFLLGENYAAWSEWYAATDNPNRDTELDYGDYEYVVPEGGFVISGHNSEKMLELATLIFGPEATAGEFNINTTAPGTFNDVVVKLVDVNGVKQLSVENGHGEVVEVPNPTLFTGTEGETVALQDYTVALDANGKIIFASYTAPGYGGPGDGFYHDGTYAAVPGSVCGIFDIDANWKSWVDATQWGSVTAEQVEYNGQMVNPWSAFAHKVPEGGKILTGSAYVMLPLINDILGTEYETLPADNSLFEGEGSVEDGALNGVVVAVAEDGSVDAYTPTAQVGQGLAVAGVADVEFKWNINEGVWESTFLAPKWTNFSLSYTDDEGNAVAIWYDNTAISGDVVTPGEDGSLYIGDTWNGGLFVDSADAQAAHQWMNSNDGGRSFHFEYDPVAKTLVITKA